MRLLLAGSLFVLGCAHHPAAAQPKTPAMISPIDRDHPLAGKVWDVERAAFTTEDDVIACLAQAPYVLLGEKHDNQDAHAIQSRLLDGILARGRRPEVDFEMLSFDQQTAVDAAVGRAPGDPDAIAAAVDWPHSGWPSFAFYRPLFASAENARVHIGAGNLPPRVARAIAFHGLGVLDDDTRATLELDRPLPGNLESALEEELRGTHCGQIPDSALPSMAAAQRARDASMAMRMAAAEPGTGAVLIAGNGHVRTDRGVPLYLGAKRPGAGIASVGVLEVQRGENEPGEYANDLGASALPFTFVFFTPRATEEDPCKGFRPPLQEAMR